MINRKYVNCGECAYWDRIFLYAPEDDDGNEIGPAPKSESGETEGQCKRYPPQLIGVPSQGDQEKAWAVTFFPVTQKNNECGEFRRAEI